MASLLPPPPSRSEVLSLLRTAREHRDYNIRGYTKRRTIDAFRENKDLFSLSSSSLSAAFSHGKSQLEISRRQSIVYSLYAPKVKSIMEIKNST